MSLAAGDRLRVSPSLCPVRSSGSPAALNDEGLAALRRAKPTPTVTRPTPGIRKNHPPSCLLGNLHVDSVGILDVQTGIIALQGIGAVPASNGPRRIPC
jgi:hypothetical protein